MRLKVYLVFFFLLPSLGFAGGKTVKWGQEVLLQDGRVIFVERVSEQTEKLFPENAILDRKQSLRFRNPDTNEEISWTIPKGLVPKILDFDNRIPYLVLQAHTVADYNNWGCPNPPYLVYQFDGSRWMSLPFEQLPSRIERRNLFDVSAAFQMITKSDTASLEDVKRYLRRLLKSQRVIDRKKVKVISEGCFEGTLYKLGRESEIRRGE